MKHVKQIIVLFILLFFSFSVSCTGPEQKSDVPAAAGPVKTSRQDKQDAIPEWRSHMDSGFVDSYLMDSKADLTPSEKIEIWQGFLTVFSEDIIDSTHDDDLRGLAGERIDFWKSRQSFHNVNGELLKPAAAVRVEKLSIYSKARNKTTHYFAFIPETQDMPARFPVLYLLHGAWDGYTAWKDHSDMELRRLAAKYGIIIITPDGDPFGWYADSPLNPNGQIETFIINELIIDAENKVPANGKRAIAGLSMGGHGAVVLALRNPGLFRTVSSMSGILDITLHPTNWGLPKVFGRYGPENKGIWEDHSAYHLAMKNRGLLDNIHLLVTVSTGDKYAISDNRAFNRLLEGMGVKHAYREAPGDHNWDYWQKQLPLHVAFHAKKLNQPGAE